MARPSKKAAAKAISARIEKAYGLACAGVQVNLLDISKIFEAGRKAIESGADDAALQEAIKAFVATIRQN
jgi:hypothetical protein